MAAVLCLVALDVTVTCDSGYAGGYEVAHAEVTAGDGGACIPDNKRALCLWIYGIYHSLPVPAGVQASTTNTSNDVTPQEITKPTLDLWTRSRRTKTSGQARPHMKRHPQHAWDAARRHTLTLSDPRCYLVYGVYRPQISTGCLRQKSNNTQLISSPL